MAVLAALVDSSGVPSVGQGPSPKNDSDKTRDADRSQSTRTRRSCCKDGSRDTVKTQTAFAPLLALDLYPPPLRPNGIHGDEDHH